MNEDIEYTDIKDEFLENIIKDNYEIKSSPDDFTNKTMDLIMRDWISNPQIEKNNEHSVKYWILLSTVISISAIIYIATDIKKIIKMSDIQWLKNIDSEYLIYIHNLYKNITATLLNISPIIYVILFSIAAIVLIDILVRKYSSHTNLLMI